MFGLEEEVESDVLLDVLSPAVTKIQDGVDRGAEVISLRSGFLVNGRV